MKDGKEIRIGIAGAGTVGSGAIKVFREQERFFREDLGLPLKLARIVDKDLRRFQGLPTGDAICSARAEDILEDPSIDIAIELIGGIGYAREFILAALAKGKHVVTANKALLAQHGPEIFCAAEDNDVSVYFEASVGGGMPIIKTIREAMVANDIASVKAIINGTCNYILTRMTRERLAFDETLRAAQAAGYAEADPELDVSGGDSGHKVAIMASLLYHGYVPYSSVSVEGIKDIAKADIEFARELGYTIKLLGIIERREKDSPIEVRVHPALLRDGHILASVSDAFNAVLLRGGAVGDILLYGKGAGELPTASAVIGDLVDVARNIAGGTPRRLAMDYYHESRSLPIRSVDELVSRYYLRFSVMDVAGVLASIASTFGKHSISISRVVQPEAVEGQAIPVVFMTHDSVEANLRAALAEIEVYGLHIGADEGDQDRGLKRIVHRAGLFTSEIFPPSCWARTLTRLSPRVLAPSTCNSSAMPTPLSSTVSWRQSPAEEMRMSTRPDEPSGNAWVFALVTSSFRRRPKGTAKSRPTWTGPSELSANCIDETTRLSSRRRSV